ncbi:MAG: ATP synthase F1 subunit epsilon [Clostridia bacterium]|jgi:F-type H+-transporting ATPase subunit epsilon|nr:ATP synthase F1 subunit epsilon [Clostridia bacterium]MBQ9291054.1 ATP synthase F1 subunit epsilon [Clostridia bacterium]MBR0216550.1 ATP synthase F1 subunit epsilon [Clostridia bacterium]
MKSFHLSIVTPDGTQFDGEAEELVVRTISGDMGIMAGHINCVTALGMGKALIVSDGKKREAACIGGILSVIDGKVSLVPTTFEWADAIDVKRAEAAEEKARKMLDDKAHMTSVEQRLAEARLKRALVRKSVASSTNTH